MLKKILPAVLLLLLPMSVVCGAEELVRHFVVELAEDQDTDRFFSIKPNLNSLSGSSSGIDDTNGLTDSGLLADFTPGGLNGYGLADTFTESISWQLFYATQLLVACGLALTNHEAPLGSKPDSWLPEEALITVGWLLKSFWDPDSLLFKPTDQPEAISISTQRDHPFEITTMVLPGQCEQKNDPANQPSASSSQQASGTTNQPGASFISPLDFGSGDGNGDPEQQRQHTYGLDCYAGSCHGVCQLRPPSDGSELAESGDDECPICLQKFSDLYVVPCCSKKIDKHCLRRIFQTTRRSLIKACPFCRADMSSTAQLVDFAESEEVQQDLPGSYNEPQPPFTISTQAAYFAATSIAGGHLTCGLATINEDGMVRPCRAVFMNASALLAHARLDHTQVRTCPECQMTLPSAQALREHRRRDHTEEQTCPECQKILLNAQALREHRRRDHTGEQTCPECQKILPDLQALLAHKRRKHSR
ncbi:C2H2-type zinc finger protein [Endozoicomonas sp. ALB032]|uniref:C2H2-type zinc finger protein n=1 Tax=Endozoicomonas sp. ALB032 TaxID=3403082 RepID=UPI003BB71092